MMRGYGEIDPIIKMWADDHKLHLYTLDRDLEIRSVTVGGGTKGSRTYQIWITEPDHNGQFQVHVANQNPPYNQEIFQTTKETLATTLDTAWKIAWPT